MTMNETKRCSGMSYDQKSARRFVRTSHPCEVHATVEVDGKWWCGRHSPVKKAAPVIKEWMAVFSGKNWKGEFVEFYTLCFFAKESKGTIRSINHKMKICGFTDVTMHCVVEKTW
jgi:hypothetical protein